MAPDGSKGRVTFIQHRLPPLESGNYKISVEQKVWSDDGRIADPAYRTEDTFCVRGERFALNPSEFHTVFPPPDHRGEFFNCLPHVVLSRSTLPWERDLAAASDDTRTAPAANDGAAVDTADRAGWLALLLFDERDLAVDDRNGGVTVGAPPTQTLTVDDILHPKQDGVLHAAQDQILSYPGMLLDGGEESTDSCNVIDVPMALFQQIAPTAEDLKYLAHARLVEKPGLGPPGPGANGDADDDTAAGEYSVVVGNRLPARGNKSTIHLVSLEGLLEYLPGATPPLDAATRIQASKWIRLVSLKSWSFWSLDEHEDFQSLLTKLRKVNDTVTLPHGTSLPSVASTSELEPAAVQAMDKLLSMGYAPLKHLTREGDRVVSWYRGPCAPSRMPSEDRPLITCADEAMRYDPGIGMLDVSLSAAWQAGRLMGLQNKAFSLALYKWKRSIRLETVNALQRAQVQRIFGTGPTETATSATVSRHPLLHAAFNVVRRALIP